MYSNQTGKSLFEIQGNESICGSQGSWPGDQINQIKKCVSTKNSPRKESEYDDIRIESGQDNLGQESEYYSIRKESEQENLGQESEYYSIIKDSEQGNLGQESEYD